MSDQDIIDIIAGAMRRRVRYPADEAAQHNAAAVLTALRERYEIVEKVTSDHDPFDILCAVNRGGPTKSDTICPRCRPAKEADQ